MPPPLPSPNSFWNAVPTLDIGSDCFPTEVAFCPSLTRLTHRDSLVFMNQQVDECACYGRWLLLDDDAVHSISHNFTGADEVTTHDRLRRRPGLNEDQRKYLCRGWEAEKITCPQDFGLSPFVDYSKVLDARVRASREHRRHSRINTWTCEEKHSFWK